MSALTLEDLTLDWFRDRCDIDPETGCWVWRGAKTEKGYGVTVVSGKKYRVHRLVYECFKGEIPPDLVIDHIYARGCRSKACCFLGHLEVVTNTENTKRAYEVRFPDKQEGFCVHGHELTEDNLYFREDRALFECRKCKWESRDPVETKKWFDAKKKRQFKRMSSYESELNWKYDNGYL